MGRWTARLAAPKAEKFEAPPRPPTDKTDETPVLSVLAVGLGGGRDEISPAANEPRTCADCLHRLPRGTCAQPEAAGLFPPGHGFGIAWAEPGHAAGCTAFAGKAPKAERPYRLSPAAADEAHAHPWDAAAVALFKARQGRLLRLGFRLDDADDLAEHLALRDVRRDDLAACVECRHVISRPWRCGNHEAAGMPRELGADLVTLLQRCPGFQARIVSEGASEEAETV